MRRTSLVLTATLFLMASTAPLTAATITIINKDAAGVGLNDPTAAAPVGGNPGTTIGEQRLNVFKEAARIWGQILSGPIEIDVDASFTALSCTASSAVLGSAGPTEVWSFTSGVPFPGTWYHFAEANELAGVDLDPTTSEITARFNSNLGNPGCLTGTYFYYGFDANHGANISFLTVALHEFAHGLGFSTVTSASTGAFLGGNPDVFDHFIFDNTAGKTWTEMATDGERVASAINPLKVAFSGTNTTAAAATKLSKKPFLYVTSPAIIAGALNVGTASFGPALTTTGVSGILVAAIDPSDGSGASTFDACSALTNGAQVNGKIALIDRGTCPYVVKVKNAQNAGAIGVVIANNTTGSAPGMAGTDPTITIPVVSVSQSDGAALRANLPASVWMALDQVALAGADTANRVLLYTPSVLVSGSSVSHFDTTAFPNLLMEPAINADLPIGVDITPPLLRDIGWTVPPPRGDFNGDFYSDILWRNTVTGENAIWYMNGTSVIGGGGFSSAPLQWSIVGGGDFNGDGKPDIVWRNTVTGDNAVWYMNGTSVIGGGAFSSAPLQWSIVGIGDFNGDGKPDVVWRNTATGNNAVWYMNGTTVLGGGAFTSAPLQWSIVSIGDSNTGGKPDIVWRNTTTGDNAIWHMDGLTVTGGGAFSSAPTNWSIVGPK